MYPPHIIGFFVAQVCWPQIEHRHRKSGLSIVLPFIFSHDKKRMRPIDNWIVMALITQLMKLQNNVIGQKVGVATFFLHKQDYLLDNPNFIITTHFAAASDASGILWCAIILYRPQNKTKKREEKKNQLILVQKCMLRKYRGNIIGLEAATYNMIFIPCKVVDDAIGQKLQADCRPLGLYSCIFFYPVHIIQTYLHTATKSIQTHPRLNNHILFLINFTLHIKIYM